MKCRAAKLDVPLVVEGGYNETSSKVFMKFSCSLFGISVFCNRRLFPYSLDTICVTYV